MTKIIKLSVAAALAATAMNAAVVDNVKVNGKAKLWYETHDNTGSFFDQANSSGQVMIDLAGSATVGALKVNLGHTTATTLGLENGVVAGTRINAADGTNTVNYVGVANVSATMGGTTVIVGKQALNTPLCFSEAWNAHKNTFEANVLVNKGLIPSTTLILADVQTTNADGFKLSAGGEFSTAVNAEMVALSGIAGSTINAYYYDLADASATWIDGSANIAGVKVNGIYAESEGEDAVAISAATKVAGLNVMAAYSTVSDNAEFRNKATDKKTKLPTQAVYVDGQNVAVDGADTWKIKLSGMKVGSVNLAIQHVNCDSNSNPDATETDIIATTKVAGLGLKAILMDNEENNVSSTKFRVIANYSF